MISPVSNSLFINISLENIILSSKDDHIVIARGDLEMNLPQALHDHFSKQDTSISEFSVYVLNGPGSFTNLRIGCLCVNMLQEMMKLKNKQIVLYNLDKQQLYKKLYDEQLIGRMGAMYIGQKKNFWVCDLAQDTVELKMIEGGNFSDFFVWENFWADSNAEPDQVNDHHIDLGYSQGKLQVTVGAKKTLVDMKELWFRQVEKIVPNYILEPNITMKSII